MGLTVYFKIMETEKIIGYKPKGEKEAKALSEINASVYGGITQVQFPTKNTGAMYNPIGDWGLTILEALCEPVYREVEKKEWIVDKLNYCIFKGDEVLRFSNPADISRLTELADQLNQPEGETVTDEEIIDKWKRDPEFAIENNSSVTACVIKLVRWALSRSKGVKKLSDELINNWAAYLHAREGTTNGADLLEMGKRVREFYEGT